MGLAVRRTSEPGDLVVACFSFDGLHVRVVMIDHEPWFVANDVCRITGIKLGNALFTVEEDDRARFSKNSLKSGMKSLRVGEDGSVWLFSESGLYDLLMRRGDRDKTQRFRRWVTHDLIPTVVRSNIASSHRADLPFTTNKVKLQRDYQTTPDKPTMLYRFYGHDGQLLYVGISWRLAERMLQHRRGKSWWSDVEDVKVEQHPSRAAANEAETLAIRTERPLYNIAKVVA
jgi:prophage antirepressor-like protein